MGEVNDVIVVHCTTRVERGGHFRYVEFDCLMIFAKVAFIVCALCGVAELATVRLSHCEPQWWWNACVSFIRMGAVLGLIWLCVSDPWRPHDLAVAQWERDQILFAEFGNVSP
jgi:hypothetical protein